MKLALLLPASAALVEGLHVTPETPQAVIVGDAMRKLKGLWPGKGADMLEEITHNIPARDGGSALRQRLLEKFQSKSKFVFASFGSSVSAGHDNVMNQSWPFELERILKPTFQALGFDFEMRQRAAGGYGEMPFAAGCMKARAGEGVDALSWEWHMFHDPACESHHFLTEAAAMKSRPVVFGFADSGINFNDNLEADACLNPWDPRKCEGMRRDARAQIMKNNDKTLTMPRAWKPNEWYLSEEFVSRDELDRWRQQSASFARAKPTWHEPVKMGWLQQVGNAAKFELEGGAFYPVSVGAFSPHITGDPWYQVREKAFNVNWHPGPLGHTLIASSIAHFMLANLELALKGDSGRKGHGPSADNPLVGPPITGVHEARQCGSLVSKQCHTGMHPVTESAKMENRMDKRSVSTWQQTTSLEMNAKVETVDRRQVFRGTKKDGELILNFEADSDDQYVLLCGAPCGWHCDAHAGWVAAKSQRWWSDKEYARQNVSDLTYTIDGRRVPNQELLQLHDHLFDPREGQFCPDCRDPADLCQPVAKVSKGPHTVGVTVEARSTGAGENMHVEIMQLMVVG